MDALADRNLLFGLIALQNGMIDQSALILAFVAWTRDKSRPLAEILVDQGALDADGLAMLSGLVAWHLKRHGGVAEKSLAAIPAAKSTRLWLADLADPDIDATLRHVSSPSETVPDAEATGTYGAPAGDGRRFRILRPHAKGGLGEVFVALDEELHREVALKQILDHHADDPTSRTRFVIEAEITGGLEHPGIVPVYGLGSHGDGRPYYAMRFIRGDSLKEAIAAFLEDRTPKSDPGNRSLALRRLLRRFVDVCNAIEYAHGRGVLHRDIKPANIIVGKHGETLVVDWGLAKPRGKAQHGRASDGERTFTPSSAGGLAETLPGQALETPAYMSPEQSTGDLDALGPRSDVYSLGATLYCLLTGRAPFEGTSLGEVIRAVQKGAFPRPRQIDPAIDGALEAVCLKAMATKPEDRHASAQALADDVERWAADEPTSAWVEPASVKARRWMRRNRTAVAAASVAILAALFGTAAVLAVQTRANADLKRSNNALAVANGKEAKASAEALAALDETRKAQAATAAALVQSEESRKQAEAVGEFLVEAFEKPDTSTEGKDVKVVDTLDQALAGLDRGFAGSKATQGAMLDALGRSYSGLGLYPKAEEAHRKAKAAREAALGPSSREALASAYELGQAIWDLGRRPEGEALLAGVLGRQEATLGLDDPDTLRTRWGLYSHYPGSGRAAEAIPQLRAVLASCESRPDLDPRLTSSTRMELAVAYRFAGRVGEAIPLYEATLREEEVRHGPDHPKTFIIRNNLAEAYLNAGRVGEAIPLFEATLRQKESKLGPDHPLTLGGRSNLANAYVSAGRVGEAIPIFEATARQLEAKLGPDHPNTFVGRNSLANAYMNAGRFGQASPILEATLRRSESKLGPDHLDTITLRSNLANAYRAVGRSGEAIPLLEEAVRRGEATLGPGHPVPVTIRGYLANASEELDRWADAEALLRESLARRRAKEKPDSPLLAGDLLGLGRNLLWRARASEAEPLLRESLVIFDKSAPDDWRRFAAASLLGGVLLAQGKFAEAEPLVVAGFEGMKAREPKINSKFRFHPAEGGGRVVQIYRSWDKLAEAAAWAARLGLAELPADVFAR